MGNKKHNKTLALIISLVAISGGMFAYQNIYMPHHLNSQKQVIYVAKNDVQAFTNVNDKNFEEVAINKDSVLPTYVTNLNQVKGLKLKGGLLKGEPLTTVRLTNKKLSEKENLTFNLEADYSGDINKDDNVKVYVLLTNKNTDEVSTKVLFENKKIVNVVSDKSNNADRVKFTISGTDKEVQDYFVAKESGKIIITRVNSLDINSIDSKERFDANSFEVKNSKKVKTKDGEAISVVSYQVQKGDTIESLSLKFKTTKQKIKELNNNKKEFQSGETITVPAI